MKQTSTSIFKQARESADYVETAGPESSARSPTQIPEGNADKHEQLKYWLGHFSQVDLLTGLPNRSQILDRLIGGMARATRSKQLVGLMLVNIDRFKALNATHGTKVADRVLKKLAERLTECTRKSDTVGRMGGDEFAVILEGLAEREGAAIATQRLLAALGRPLQLEGSEITVTATAGVALYPTDADSIDTLLQNADLAISYAREHGRATLKFYSPEVHLQNRDNQLRRAKIEQGLARLTPREREVLQILVAGNANKMIAYMLGTSTRTIDIHRARIMEKMDARSLPELVRMVLTVPGAATSLPRVSGSAR